LLEEVNPVDVDDEDEDPKGDAGTLKVEEIGNAVREVGRLIDED